eukprot:2228495-Prymnesium_polylepis.2
MAGSNLREHRAKPNGGRLLVSQQAFTYILAGQTGVEYRPPFGAVHPYVPRRGVRGVLVGVQPCASCTKGKPSPRRSLLDELHQIAVEESLRRR